MLLAISKKKKKRKSQSRLLVHFVSISKDSCRENSLLKCIQFSMTINDLVTLQLSSLAAWVIICKTIDLAFSHYIMPYGNPPEHFADHGLLCKELLFTKSQHCSLWRDGKNAFLVFSLTLQFPTLALHPVPLL